MSLGRFLYVVQMDIPAAEEAEFNRVYDEEHLPHLQQVLGVVACTRYLLERSKQPGMPRYTVIYELESPDVITSPEWIEAARKGSWFERVRPLTHNKRNYILRRVG